MLKLTGCSLFGKVETKSSVVPFHSLHHSIPAHVKLQCFCLLFFTISCPGK